MRAYQMQQPIQYYRPKSRKPGEIKPIGSKVPYFVWLLLLFVSFAFAGLFMTKMTMTSYVYLFSEYTADVDYTAFYFSTLAMVALFEAFLLYCQLAVYNYIARWYLRGEIPCTTRELFKSTMPFFVLRNIIWGALSLLMFLPSGVFVSIGSVAFETIATMIIFLPCFYAIKKRYIKQGYGKEIMQAYAVPYVILQITFLIF